MGPFMLLERALRCLSADEVVFQPAADEVFQSKKQRELRRIITADIRDSVVLSRWWWRGWRLFECPDQTPTLETFQRLFDHTIRFQNLVTEHASSTYTRHEIVKRSLHANMATLAAHPWGEVTDYLEYLEKRIDQLMETKLRFATQIADHQGFFKTLGFDANIQPDKVGQLLRTHYTDLVKTWHPDRGGNKEQMQKINEAFEKMRDPITRAQDLSGKSV